MCFLSSLLQQWILRGGGCVFSPSKKHTRNSYLDVKKPQVLKQERRNKSIKCFVFLGCLGDRDFHKQLHSNSTSYRRLFCHGWQISTEFIGRCFSQNLEQFTTFCVRERKKEVSVYRGRYKQLPFTFTKGPARQLRWKLRILTEIQNQEQGKITEGVSYRMFQDIKNWINIQLCRSRRWTPRTEIWFLSGHEEQNLVESGILAQ